MCESCDYKTVSEPNPPDLYLFIYFLNLPGRFVDASWSCKAATGAFSKDSEAHGGFFCNWQMIFLEHFMSWFDGHITEHSPQFQQEFGDGNHWGVLYCLRPPFSSCVYTFQNPRPTALLKMQKVREDSMFNAWSCQPRSSELIPDQDWGGWWWWGVSEPQSWHMKAVSGNDRFQEQQILWESGVFRGGPGLFTVYSCTR